MTSRWPTERDPLFGCDLWRGRLDRDGYGVVTVDGRFKLAHRVAWERDVGPIPPGMVIEHCCARRNCVRVAHHELTSQSENLRRRSFRNRIKRTRCRHGHDLKLHGIVLPTSGVVCRLCNREH